MRPVKRFGDLACTFNLEVHLIIKLPDLGISEIHGTCRRRVAKIGRSVPEADLIVRLPPIHYAKAVIRAPTTTEEISPDEAQERVHTTYYSPSKATPPRRSFIVSIASRYQCIIS